MIGFITVPKNLRRLNICWVLLLLFCLTLLNSCLKANSKLSNKALTGKVETIQLQYISWACYCPNWVKPAEIEAARSNTSLCFHIEPAFDSIVIPAKLLQTENLFQFEGQFYKTAQSRSAEDGVKAITFKYTSFLLVDSL